MPLVVLDVGSQLAGDIKQSATQSAQFNNGPIGKSSYTGQRLTRFHLHAVTFPDNACQLFGIVRAILEYDEAAVPGAHLWRRMMQSEAMMECYHSSFSTQVNTWKLV